MASFRPFRLFISFCLLLFFPKIELTQKCGILSLQELIGKTLNVILHEKIRNDECLRNIALQCWNNVVTIPPNVVTMLQSRFALKIVVANRLV